MPELVQATVNTKTNDLFRFMLFHAYSRVSGVITLFFSIISLVMLPVSYFVLKDNFMSAAFGFIVLFYLILTPLNMFSQSRRQVLANPVFKNPITYHISEEIFEIQQYTGTVRFYWSQLLKVKKTPYDYLFYVNTEQAFILPKRCIADEEVETLNKIIESVKDEIDKKSPDLDESQVSSKKTKGKKEKPMDQLEKQLTEMAERDEREEAARAEKISNAEETEISEETEEALASKK